MNRTIPISLKKIIGSEPTDFIFRSKRNYPLKKGLGQLFFSLIWNGFVSIFAFAFIIPMIKEITSNDFEKVDLFEVIFATFPAIIIFIFVFIGIYLFIDSFVKIFQKGAYFAITKTRFIKYRNGKISVTDWGLFTGNITVNTKGNSGDIEFQLKSGKTQKQKYGPNEFVPDFIYIAGINNIFEIEKQCRLRISEHNL